MKITISKKTVIIGIIVLAYIAALPLTLYFSGAFKRTPQPDLKKLTANYNAQYVNMTDEEKRGILSGIGFDLQAFEDAGFIFATENIRVNSFENEPERWCFLSTEITDAQTYYIKLSIYAPEADGQFHRFAHQYERREINGKAVGFYEPDGGDLSDQCVARYRDAQGNVFYVEPFNGFSEIDYSFLGILISQ